jgi:3-hydroxymyristoyl/3-hydroxydecanoyl-(acyl carrier protein) dehydratase
MKEKTQGKELCNNTADLVDLFVNAHRQMTEGHRLFLQTQQQALNDYLETMNRLVCIDFEEKSIPENVCSCSESARILAKTDVESDRWYLHNGRMPAGMLLEAVQADRLLESASCGDMNTAGDFLFRVCGFEITFHGPLPEAGEDLHFETSVQKSSDNDRLLDFRSDGSIAGTLRVSIRNGSSGLFRRDEIAKKSAARLCSMPTGIDAESRVPGSADSVAKSRFNQKEIEAWLSGDLSGCFGRKFFWADPHTRTPLPAFADKAMIEEVTSLVIPENTDAGGYLRAEKAVNGDNWFFKCQCKNDPVMPVSLLFETCLQAMAFYFTAAGRTLHRDGWRFQPVNDVRCRVSVGADLSADSGKLVCEVFVTEIRDNAMPVIFADVLCRVDGKDVLFCEDLGLQLVPDWPISSMPEFIRIKLDLRPSQKSVICTRLQFLINCALGYRRVHFQDICK